MWTVSILPVNPSRGQGKLKCGPSFNDWAENKFSVPQDIRGLHNEVGYLKEIAPSISNPYNGLITRALFSLGGSYVAGTLLLGMSIYSLFIS